MTIRLVNTTYNNAGAAINHYRVEIRNVGAMVTMNTNTEKFRMTLFKRPLTLSIAKAKNVIAEEVQAQLSTTFN